MIIFCCGMRRSASTFHYHLTRELLPDYTDLGWITWQEFNPLLGQNSILKCHPFIPDYSPLAKHLFESGEAKAVYIYRDIRDVISSILRLEKDTGQSFISNLEDDINSILSTFYKWTSLKNVYISRYEQVVKYPIVEVLLLAQYLGVKITYRKAVQIARKYNPENQRKRQPILEWDSSTTMHPYHIGTGEIGQWRHTLTPEQLEIVLSLAGNWLKELDYV